MLDDFVTPEIISGYDCANNCPTQNPTEKTLDILSTPKVLVLQLKRFQGLQKIDDFVRFPSKLRLNFASVGNGEHHLTGVVVHEGSSLRVGHYVAYVLADDQWLEANDCSIRKVSWEYVSTKEAYLLLYVRL